MQSFPPAPNLPSRFSGTSSTQNGKPFFWPFEAAGYKKEEDKQSEIQQGYTNEWE